MSDQPSPTNLGKRQLGIRQMLGLVVIASVVMAVSVYFDLKSLPFAGAAAFIAWGLHRFGEVPRGSAITLATGGIMFAVAWQFKPQLGDWFPHPIHLLALLLGFCSSFASTIYFTVLGSTKRIKWRSAIVGALFALMLPVTWVFVVIPYLSHLREAERARQLAYNQQVSVQIVRDVDAVCARLGRAPKDQEELEKEMGHPMPFLFDGGIQTPIRYSSRWNGGYQLRYEFWASDDWTYSSSAPQLGWVQSFY